MPSMAEKGGIPIPAVAHLSQPGSGSPPPFGVGMSPDQSLPAYQALVVLPAAPTPHLPGQVLPAASGSSFSSLLLAPHRDLCAALAGSLCLAAVGCSSPPHRSHSSVLELLPVGKQSPTSSFVFYFIFISRDFCTTGGSPRSRGKPLPPPLHVPLPSGAHGSVVVRLLPCERRCVASGWWLLRSGSALAVAAVIPWASKHSRGYPTPAPGTPAMLGGERVHGTGPQPRQPRQGRGTCEDALGKPPSSMVSRPGLGALSCSMRLCGCGAGRGGGRAPREPRGLREAPPGVGDGRAQGFWSWWDRPRDHQEKNPQQEDKGWEVGEEHGQRGSQAKPGLLAPHHSGHGCMCGQTGLCAPSRRAGSSLHHADRAVPCPKTLGKRPVTPNSPGTEFSVAGGSVSGAPGAPAALWGETGWGGHTGGEPWWGSPKVGGGTGTARTCGWRKAGTGRGC